VEERPGFQGRRPGSGRRLAELGLWPPARGPRGVLDAPDDRWRHGDPPPGRAASTTSVKGARPAAAGAQLVRVACRQGHRRRNSGCSTPRPPPPPARPPGPPAAAVQEASGRPRPSRTAGRRRTRAPPGLRLLERVDDPGDRIGARLVGLRPQRSMPGRPGQLRVRAWRTDGDAPRRIAASARCRVGGPAGPALRPSIAALRSARPGRLAAAAPRAVRRSPGAGAFLDWPSRKKRGGRTS